jgi:lipopolysaccharide export system protein LptC
VHAVIKTAKDAWERFLLYLPLVVMGLLALGTYWLVRSTPSLGPTLDARPPSHEPDYFMEGFSVRTFDATGRIRSEVSGEKARHFPDTQWMEIDGIHIRSFDERGRMTTATAKRGLTNEDASEVKLLGNAVVVREAAPSLPPNAAPRLEYRSEFLHAFMTTEQVKSNKPVELFRGKDRFSADSLDFDNVEQVLQLRGRVRGTLVPEQ